jgi:hypothetical protein
MAPANLTLTFRISKPWILTARFLFTIGKFCARRAVQSAKVCK